MPIFRFICQQELKVIREAPIEVEADDEEQAFQKTFNIDHPEDGWHTISTEVDGWSFSEA
jgi:hypothetical protein